MQRNEVPMILEIIMMLFVLWVTVYTGMLLRDIMIPGLLSGKLQARGRYYTRADQPIRFWCGIFFWISMFLLGLFASVVFVSEVWTRLHGL